MEKILGNSLRKKAVLVQQLQKDAVFRRVKWPNG